MGKTLSVLVSVGMSPGVLEWTGLLTVAQPRSGSQHPGTGQQQQQQQQPGLLFLLLQDPGLSSVQLKCFCTLLLKNSIKKKKKSKRHFVRSKLCCIRVKIFFGIHRMIRLIHWTFARFL